MGFPTKVQCIQRRESEQWYINFPSAIAQAMDFAKGETVEWTIHDKASGRRAAADGRKQDLNCAGFGSFVVANG